MDTALIVLVVAVLVTVALSLVMYYVKQSYLTKLMKHLSESEFEAFYALINKGIIKYLFPKFNVEYLKLNAVIMEGNKRKINDSFKSLLAMKMNKKQEEDVTIKAFNYYVGMEDKIKCKELFEKIQTFSNVRMIEEATLTYDIFIQKKWNHIDDILAIMEDLPENNRAIYEYLLSVQYENKGELDKAKEYEELSKKHMEMPVEN